MTALPKLFFALFAVSAASFTSPAFAAPAAGPTGEQAASALAVVLERAYVDPVIAKRYAQALKAQQGAYADAKADQALADRINADLAAVHADKHLKVREERPMAAGGPAAIETGIDQAETIAPGVRLLRMHAFFDEDVAAIDRFFQESAGARAIVLDFRENRGGGYAGMDALLSNLFAAPRHVMTLEARASALEAYGDPLPKAASLRRVSAPNSVRRLEHRVIPSAAAQALADTPVYVLTSARTFSAAEHVAFALKNAGRATLIGETTAGGGHFGRRVALGQGRLTVFVPFGRAFDPATGAQWDETGIAPNVAAPAAQAMDVALARITPVQAGAQAPDRAPAPAPAVVPDPAPGPAAGL